MVEIRRDAAEVSPDPDVAAGSHRTDDHVEVAVLDRDGVIVSVNAAWLDFCRDNGGDPARAGVGSSYPAICAAAVDDPVAQEIGAAVERALAGDLPAPLSFRSRCDSPDRERWYDVLISSRYDDAGACVGATVTLVPGTSRPKSPEAELTFPDVPRLELEQLLLQLTERAQDVLLTQGRLRALLRAHAVVAGELDLRNVLRHIVAAARELVDARYGALGVIGADGSLEEFVHVGMDEALVQRIGHLPTGQGILGLLITSPEPVRLTELGAHADAVGFPPGHPPMGSFLGVPIRVRDKVFGNLYLTQSGRGEFSSDDEQLVVSLASSAGVAIEHARLFEESEQRRQWQSVTAVATSQLFAGEVGDPVEVVLRAAMEGAGGDLALLGLLVGDDEVKVTAAVGALADELRARPMRLQDSVAADVLRSGEPALINDYGSRSRAARPVATAIGSVIIAPLVSSRRIEGALTVGRLAGARPFRQADLDQLIGFANHAGLALELDRGRADREALARLQDHDRIAAELHDHVIHELFQTGMGLQGLTNALDRPEHQARVLDYVDAIDATIARIRTSIFELQKPPNAQDGQGSPAAPS